MHINRIKIKVNYSVIVELCPDSKVSLNPRFCLASANLFILTPLVLEVIDIHKSISATLYKK